MAKKIELSPGEKPVCFKAGNPQYLLVCCKYDIQLTRDQAVKMGRLIGGSIPNEAELRQIFNLGYLDHADYYWVDFPTYADKFLIMDGNDPDRVTLTTSDRMASSIFVRRIPIVEAE